MINSYVGVGLLLYRQLKFLKHKVKVDERLRGAVALCSRGPGFNSQGVLNTKKRRHRSYNNGNQGNKLN